VQNPHATILDFLLQNDIQFLLFDHQPIHTCEQSTQLVGLAERQGAKSLLLKTKDDFILVILAGDKKLDSKKLKTALRTKHLRFASPEEVQGIMGCEIGACYPFGNLLGINVFVDFSLSDTPLISFSPGVRDKSVLIKWADFSRVLQPELVNVAL